MGMLATVMNAIAIEQTLRDADIPARVFSGGSGPDDLRDVHPAPRGQTAFEAGEVTIFAGGIGTPVHYHRHRRRAARRGDGLRRSVQGHQVDGVYSADPKTRQERRPLRPAQLCRGAGARAWPVMDAAAIALARDNRIPVIVFSILQAGAFVDILKGEGRATIVSDDPAALDGPGT